jgi:exopolysaccharide biosynthesis polyprenyl glycosylphosphotransferase
MYPIRRKILINAFKLFDILNMGICLILSMLAVSNGVTIPSLSQLGQVEIKILNLVFFLIALFAGHLIFLNFKLYHSKRLAEKSKEIADVLKATSACAILILIEGILFKIDAITVSVIAVFWCLCSLTTIVSRIVLRYFLKWIRVYGRNLRYVLIIGTNRRAIQFAEKLLSSPELGYRLIGFVDNEWIEIDNLRNNKNRLVCNLDNFQSFIRNKIVDEVIIALPVKSFYDQASRIITICEEQGIIVRYLSSIFPSSKTDYFSQSSLIPLSYRTIYGYPSIAKRMMDIGLSSIFLLLSMPIFIIVPIAIKLISPGPVFYIQERVGLGKRRFRLYKFRTMNQNAEQNQAELEDFNEVSGPVFKIKDDPRITPIGKFLRKTSIDELPQFISVFKGEMSIVGPRPLPVRDYNGFNQDWHRRRFSVRPGITCLWQIQGRSTIPFDRWMELDMEYIDRWSLWLDIKILLKTIPMVLRGIGAA